jgi:hypothetical protein
MMSILDAIPGFSYAKLALAAAGIAAVAVPTTGWIITAHTLHGVREWQTEVVGITSAAAHVVDKQGKPAQLKASDVPAQIEQMGNALDRVKDAGVTAQARVDSNNARIGNAQDAVTKGLSDDIDKNIADARVLGAAAVRMRAAQGPGADHNGSSSQSGAPASLDAAAAASSPGGMSVMDADDVRICGDNTVKLLEWQVGWRKVAAIPANRGSAGRSGRAR